MFIVGFFFCIFIFNRVSLGVINEFCGVYMLGRRGKLFRELFSGRADFRDVCGRGNRGGSFIFCYNVGSSFFFGDWNVIYFFVIRCDFSIWMEDVGEGCVFF